jgi:hypothetical protein
MLNPQMPEPKLLIDVPLFTVVSAAAKLKPAVANFTDGQTNGGTPQHSRFWPG